MPELPLGKEEGLRLAFRSRSALDRLESVVREAVAMLNAAGGEVWVGLQQESGKAVGIEPIPDLRRVTERLGEYLRDRVDSCPSEDELRLDSCQGVLRITLKPDPGRQPYALVTADGRLFLVRLGARVLPMSADELAAAFRRRRPDDRLVADLWSDLRQAGEAAGGAKEGRFWLSLKLSPGLSLDLGAIDDSRILIDPGQTFNRFTGNNFAQAYVSWGRLPEKIQTRQGRGLRLGEKEGQNLVVQEDGGVVLEAPLSSFSALSTGGSRDGAKLLWPEALIEYPVSVFRLAGALCGEPRFWKEGEPLAAGLGAHFALFGLEGWELRSGAPGERRHASRGRFYPDRDLILGRPLLFTGEEVFSDPDGCGYRLVQQVYEGFQLAEADLPPWFDRQRHLTLRE